MDPKQIIPLMLDYDFYTSNKARLTKELFPAPLDTLYRTINTAHERYQRDLTFEELESLYEANNPLATTAAKTAIYALLDQVQKLPPIGKDVAADVLESMWRKEMGRQIAQAALDLTDGTTKDLGAVKELMERADGGFVPDTTTKPISADLDELMEFFNERTCWQFNIPDLHARLPGGAAGEFMIWFARPEMGKTAGWISLTAGPGGFCEQGAKVHAFVNEEPGQRTMMRAINARTGMSRQQVRDNLPLAKSRLRGLREQLEIYDSVDLTLEELDAHCKEHKPDVVIIDQLDKVHTNGSFDRPDLRLAHIYRNAREIAKRHGCFVIAISQASDAATGKTHVTPDMLAGSRTDKFAEGDIIIGVGAFPDTGPEQNMARVLYVGKNKITGFHGAITCVLNQELSRYEA